MGYRGMSETRGLVEIANATLRYAVDGAGIPLLVLGSSIYYPRTFSEELRQSCAIACADLPHFVPVGPKFNPACIGFDFYSECIEAIRADARLGRVVVVGHSHHGNLALEYARRQPDNVSHVVLIGTPPVNVAKTMEAAEQYWESHATKERKTILQQRRSPAQVHNSSRSALESYVRQYVIDAPLYWNDPQYDASHLWKGMSFSMDIVHAFRDLYRSYELKWDGALRSTPVLVVMGVNDFAVPHTLWTEFLPDLENVTFRLLQHSGHTPQLEEREEFNRVLLNWLKPEGAH